MENKQYRLVFRRYKHPLEILQKGINPHVDEDSEAYENDFIKMAKPFNGQILYNENGIIPITQDSLPSKSYNLWLVDSNFKFPKKTVELLNYCVEGIEGFKLITPYQLLIGIARLFDEDKVKDNLNSVLLDYMEEKTPSNPSEDIVKNTLKNYVSLLDTDTKVNFILHAENEEDLNKQVNKYLLNKAKNQESIDE